MAITRYTRIIVNICLFLRTEAIWVNFQLVKMQCAKQKRNSPKLMVAITVPIYVIHNKPRDNKNFLDCKY